MNSKTYVIWCLCGAKLTSTTREFVCNCGQKTRAEWPCVTAEKDGKK